MQEPTFPIGGRMRRFQTFAVITVLATIVLIAIGSTVRTTGSGLGCPDWPLCHGRPYPPFERTAIIEYTHRSAAALVGLLIIVQAAWVFTKHRADRTLVTLAAISLPLLLVQALLGAVTVKLELPPEVVAVHLTTAFALLAVLTLIACCAALGPARRLIEGAERRSFTRVATIAAITTAAILLIGAYTVATHAGFACTTWPSCREAQIPFFSGERLQHIHWLHRFTVLGGAAIIGWVFLNVHEMRSAGRMLQRGAHSLIGLYGVQILIGGLNIISGFAGVVRVSHLAVASAIWAVTIAMAFAGRYHGTTEAAAAPSTARDGTQGARV